MRARVEVGSRSDEGIAACFGRRAKTRSAQPANIVLDKQFARLGIPLTQAATISCGAARARRRTCLTKAR
jgi:hypothetical protein